MGHDFEDEPDDGPIEHPAQIHYSVQDLGLDVAAECPTCGLALRLAIRKSGHMDATCRCGITWTVGLRVVPLVRRGTEGGLPHDKTSEAPP